MSDEDYGPGCDCTELCSMGPTCPGGMLAGLPDAGCWRTADGLRERVAVLAEDWERGNHRPEGALLENGGE